MQSRTAVIREFTSKTRQEEESKLKEVIAKKSLPMKEIFHNQMYLMKFYN